MKRNEAQPESIPAVANDSSNVLKSSAMLSSKVTGFELSTLKRFLRNMGNPPFIIELWDGTEVGSAEWPAARIRFTDRAALYKLFFNPDLQFGELYVDNRLQVEGDLYKTIRVLCDALPDFTERGIMHRVLAYAYLLKRNTMDRAKDNIHHHYDIGNDFYRLWLDDQFVYTCAYFRQASMSLEQAQIAKLDHVCRKLQLQPGMQVVEAGCGWGALALHMARHYGVSVKAYNISKEQLAYARTRAANEGLTEQVEFIEGDYRQIQGEYDIFVSVGMLEHVGVKHYRELGETINRVLRPQGRGLIHTIGRNRPMPMNAWIERHIFPGAYPPSLGEMTAIFEPFRFSILDVENLRLHYAETLRHWLERFDQNTEQVRQMFDESFIRSWRMYLAGSRAAFDCGELQLFQVVFNRFNNPNIPATRDFLYTD